MFTTGEHLSIIAGQTPFIYATTGTVTAPTGHKFVCIVSDVVTTYSANSIVGDNLASQLRDADSVRVGQFDSVTISGTGGLICYYK
jgi:hypothetical protein